MTAIKTVIVTGGTGFIGKALAGHLRSLGVTVFTVGSEDCDLTSAEATRQWFSEHGECDHLFNLAALYKAGGWPVEHPATQFHANLAININVLDAWSRHIPDAKLTSVLSYCMYPPHDKPHPEEELWGTEPEEYLFSYAMTKKALLVGHRAYKKEFGLNSTSVVLPTVYGPGDSFSEDSHVMGALVGKFVRAARNNAEDVEVWGDGSQEREFLYVGDAVDGIVTAALHSKEEVLNMGAGGSETIENISLMIADSADYKGKINFVTQDRFVGVLKRELDSSRIAQILGWRAQTPLRKGIGDTVDWYRRQIA